MLKYSVITWKFAILWDTTLIIANSMNYTVLDKDTIKNQILPHLPVAKRGFVTKACIIEIINAILYKLKVGCQWEHLPVEHLFSGEVLKHGAVFHHYRKWCKGGHWKDMFVALLSDNKTSVDLSVTHTDGSHTPCTKGGEVAAYQGRKKRKTTNAIYLTDRQGLPLAMSEPMKGNHNDVYEIESSMTEIFSTIEAAGISVDGIFNNADAGFDCADFHAVCVRHGVTANVCENPKYNHEDASVCFDEVLYKERYVIERSNAWMDSFRTLLLCHDTTASSWKGWNYLAFAVLLLKKIHKSQKFK